MRIFVEILMALMILGSLVRYYAAEIYLWWLDFDHRLEKHIEQLDREIAELEAEIQKEEGDK